MPPETGERIQSLGAAREEASGSFRWQTWNDCLRAATRSPLVGEELGAFADILPPYKRGWGGFRIDHAENDYLELLVEAGLVGLGLVVVFAGKAVPSLVSGLRNASDRHLRGIGVGALAALAA